MSVAELKIEIQKALLSELPEDVLQNALVLLKGGQDKENAKAKRAAHIKLILEEDKELLDQLAK